MEHSEYYSLEIKLQGDKKKWYIFAQGISPLFYNFEGLQYFRIYKQTVVEHEFQKKDLTWKFIRFQQFYKQRVKLKKLVIQNLRKLQTGEVTLSQLETRSMLTHL